MKTHSAKVYQRLIQIKTQSYIRKLFDEPVLGRRADLSLKFARDIASIVNDARQNNVGLFRND